jgi:diaminopimelate epimerase
MKFTKYHALGNDYIVLDPADYSRLPAEPEIQRICHRNFGVGSDGILWGPIRDADGRFRVRIFNPDGSEAEKSGNGIRIFSRYLWDKHLVASTAFPILTLGGEVLSEVAADGRSVRVDMGRVSFNSSDIPVRGEEREVLNEEIVVGGQKLNYCAATIGNPHCVVLCPEPTEGLARQIGPLLEIDERFPNRTNVQFMRVIDRNNIEIEIWERGAGYTLASGSSSSASAAVARRLGLCDGEIVVHMPGGRLDITVADDYSVTMEGPVTKVCEGAIDLEIFANAMA